MRESKTPHRTKIFIPDYSDLNESYITNKDKALEISNATIVLPDGIFTCPDCGELFTRYESSRAISKFDYAPKGCTTMGGYVWWTVVHHCNREYLIKVTGRD